MGFSMNDYPDKTLEYAVRKQQAIQIVTTILSNELFIGHVESQPDDWGTRTKGFLQDIQDKLLQDGCNCLSDRQYNWLVSIYQNVVEDSLWVEEMRRQEMPEKHIQRGLRQRRIARKSERQSNA